MVTLPWWSTLPFAAMLLAVAVLPLTVPHFWESNRHRAWVSLACGAPPLLGMLWLDPQAVRHSVSEYISFIVLLGSLYVIASGIAVHGRLRASPGSNSLFLLAGSVLASLIGTTGASMLLIRPLLRANRDRQHQAHVVIFFIFMVSNIGGLLTPLGDPPLFLGFLRGVPFFWTLRLAPAWCFATGFLALTFYMVDRTLLRRGGTIPAVVGPAQARLQLHGTINVVFLLAIVGTVIVTGWVNLPTGVAELCMVGIAAASWVCTPPACRRDNAFTWGPMVEVAVLFAGIFASMIPALSLLNMHGERLALTAPWQFFWATGLLSSFLDNAPTYLALSATAAAALHADVHNLATLIATPRGANILHAISLGAVLMGANTYIGNGPNLMVRAIAEEHGIKMPNFFGYMGWSGAVLIPLFCIMTWLFIA